jgi:hypothetical protein
MNMQNETDMVMEEELLETMKLLEQEVEEHGEKQEQSPTLTASDVPRRPKIKMACESCPNSMWFSSPQEVKCYCRIMRSTSKSEKSYEKIG